MTTGTYTGSYTSISNPGVANITLTAAGEVSGGNTIASVYVGSTFETLTNLGTIVNTIAQGVELNAGGNITNGSSGDTTALISSQLGAGLDHSAVDFQGTVTGTVTNFGTILSAYPATGDAGITAQDGLVVTNSGYIYGNSGGIVTNADATDTADTTITNSGTIVGGYAYGAGIFVAYAANAVITNEADGLIESNAYASQEGIVCVYGDATITNLGTIESLGSYTGASFYPGGVLIGTDGTVTNGSSADTTALITGYAYGVEVGYMYFNHIGGVGTVINFGTISSSGTETGVTFYDYDVGSGYSVKFFENATATDRLIDEPGAVFIGVSGVYGGGPDSVLELASASSAGTLGGLYNDYRNFGTISVDAGAQWDLTGDNTVKSFKFTTYSAADAAETFKGTVTFENAGTVTVESGATLDFAKGGVLSGDGTIDVDGGKLDLGVKVSSALLGFTGAGMIKLKQNGAYTGIGISGFGSNDTIVLADRAWAAGDKAVYADGTIKVKSSSGISLGKIAVSEVDDVTSLKIADVGGKVAIEIRASAHTSVAGVHADGFAPNQRAGAGSDASELLGRSPLLGGGEAGHHEGRLESDLFIGNSDPRIL